MNADGGSSYCGHCGNAVGSGDRFCGACGAAVMPAAPQAEQVVPHPVAAAQGSGAGRRSRPILLAGALGALAVLLLGGGALAFVGLGGGSMLRPPTQNPPPATDDQEIVSTPREVTQEQSTPATSPPEPSWMSSDEIAELEGFGREYDEASRSEDWAATYAMLDDASRREITEEEWAEAQQERLEDEGGHPATLESVGVEQQEEVADGPVTLRFRYGDGTEDTITAILPNAVMAGEVASPGRSLTEEELADLGVATSSPPEPTSSASPEPTDFGLSPGGEDGARNAAEQYYYAVDSEVWDTTYYNLDAGSKALFTEEEWAQKNQWYADNEDLELDSMTVDVTMDGEETAYATVNRTFTDGTSISRETVFVWEGYWRHHLTEEEKAIFMPGVPYEEFVEAQG